MNFFLHFIVNQIICILYILTITLCKCAIIGVFTLLHVHFSYRSSRPEVFCKWGVVRNFTKFTGKHLCQSFFNKVAGLTPATLLKKRLWYRCFPVNFAKFLRTPSVAASVASYILHFYLKTIYNSSICILLSIIKNIRWIINL